MQIINMIEQGQKLGGLPAHIELSPEEATLLIDEVNTLRSQKDTQHQRYNIQMGGIVARLKLIGRELSKEEKLQLLADWTSGKMTIAFDGVELRIVIVADKDKQYHD